jgi:uncharacterized membrane protein
LSAPSKRAAYAAWIKLLSLKVRLGIKEEECLNFETSKILGGVGAILMFIGVLPLFAYSGIISLVGLILALIAFKGLADYYSEAGIFNNALYAVITAIVGGIVTVAVVFIALVDFLTELGLSLGNVAEWSTELSGIDWATIGFDIIGNFITYILLALVVLFVFVIITTILLRKSLGLLSAKSGVGLFGTTGLLILIGAVLTIIAIGLVLIWIAMLILAIAFFTMKPQASQPAAPAQM